MTGPSPKSGSDSKPQAHKTWSLKKTLSRKTSFRPIEDEDVAYIWAACRKGMKIPQVPDALAAEPFRQTFAQMVLDNYDACWTLFANDERIGLAFAFWLHPQVEQMVFNGFTWFPWSSPRSRLEGAVKFFHIVRREIPMIGFVGADQIGFFDVLKGHGIIRRVGTAHIMGDSAATYETRWEH